MVNWLRSQQPAVSAPDEASPGPAPTPNTMQLARERDVSHASGGFATPLKPSLDLVVCGSIDQRIRREIEAIGDPEYRPELAAAFVARAAAESDAGSDLGLSMDRATDRLACLEVDHLHARSVELRADRDLSRLALKECDAAAAELPPLLSTALLWTAAALICGVGVAVAIGASTLLVDALDEIYLRGWAEGVFHDNAAHHAVKLARRTAYLILGALAVGVPLLATLIGAVGGKKRTIAVLAIGADAAIVIAVFAARAQVGNPEYAAPAGLLELGVLFLTTAAAFAGHQIAQIWRSRRDVHHQHAQKRRAQAAALAQVEADLEQTEAALAKQRVALQVREEADHATTVRRANASATAKLSYTLGVLANQGALLRSRLSEQLDELDESHPLDQGDLATPRPVATAGEGVR